MGSYDRVDFYRRNRDYGGLLDDDGAAAEEAEQEEEYEDDESDQRSEEGGKYESDEDPAVARERQQYLERRAKLKELERQKLKQKLNGVYGRKDDIDSESETKKLPYDNYGSFFGPSQPVVARRVIEETRARLEAAKVAARVAKEIPEKSHAVESDTRYEDIAPPKASVSEAKKKAQKLREARDYSFLFSEDAEIPGTETKTDKSSRQGTDNGQQIQTNSKHLTSLKKPAISSKQMHSMMDAKGAVKPPRQLPSKVGTQAKTPSAKPRPLSDPRKEMSKVGSGYGRPALQGNGSLQRSVNNAAIQGNGSLQRSANNAVIMNGAESNKKKAPSMISSKARNDELQRSTMQRPTSVQKPPLSKAPMQKPQLEQRRPSALAKPSPKLVNKFEARSAVRPAPKPAPRPTPNLPPKPQVKPARPPVSRNLPDERPKKRIRDEDFDDDDNDGGNYRSLIRQMFGYNPNKYRDIDDDDRAMEVGFSTIQNEEKRSARIAREEDERELALIEAEEREERLRAKKRKLQKK
ncbi:hypothetical protein SUGI_1120020 [Cryptomeria japonica]|uniref:uncharacterized protein LOC131051400 isoform X2 n=1 Tax=Cryptomeria japonica TaxID=3369 RepID=UPI0024148A0D|nr:uncharacterized protein LOC131051400 isoform X2 [Cryptomeria japonica]GLJ52623.1 hypothetical protein SUGI_1120020 [Cryptomeria japonica]